MSDTNNQVIANNTFFLYIRMFVILVLTLFISRILFKTLGVSDYGIFEIVNGFVMLFYFLESTLSGSMSRYYNYEREKRGGDGICDVYSNGLYIHVLFSFLVLLILGGFGYYYTNNVMNLPQERLPVANLVFFYSLLSFIFLLLSIPYSAAIISFERMDLYAFVSTISIILKFIAALSIKYYFVDKLLAYSQLLCIISLQTFLLYLLIAKRTFTSLIFKRKIKIEYLKEFLSFSGWNFFGTFAFMLRGQGINLVLNSFYGIVINAARGFASQIVSAVSGFSGAISNAFRPQIVESFAAGDRKRVEKLFFGETKICFILVFLLALPLCANIQLILRIWLGMAVPDYTTIFSILMLVDLLICVLNTPVTHIAFADGDIKKYQILNSMVNIALIPACWLALKIGADATSVFYISIVFSIINQLVCLLCVKAKFSFIGRDYLKTVIYPLLKVVVLSFLVVFAIRYFCMNNIICLILTIVGDLIVVPVLFYKIVLDNEEKASFVGLVKAKILSK